MTKPNLRFWRRFVQGMALVAAGVAAVRGALSLSGQPSLESYCPFGAVESAWQLLAEGRFLAGIGWGNVLALSVAVAIALLAGRAFCGWLCPLGALQDALAAISRRLLGTRREMPISLPRKVDRLLRWAKYLVLGWVLWLSISAVVPPLNAYCPLRTLFGLQAGSLLPIGIGLTFVTASMSIERFWCRYLCPLGAVLAPFNRISWLRIRVDPLSCRLCGRCASDCPAGIDPARDGTMHPECLRCLDCIAACRRGAVNVVVGGRKPGQ